MLRIFKKSIDEKLYFLIILIVMLLTPRNIYAQTDALNLTISPTSILLETDPGVEKKAELKIRNNSKSQENLQITVGKFTSSGDSDKPQLLDLSKNDETVDWLTFDKTKLRVDSNEWETVNVTFSPPKDAALSYYYVIYITRENTLLKKGETTIVGSPAVLTIASVRSPNAKRELVVEKFEAQSSFLEFLPEEFNITIKNTGNVYVIPKGNIFIDGPSKKDIGILSINPGNGIILPGTKREYTVSWSDGFPVYQYDKKENNSSLVWDFNNASKLRIGKYKANLLLVYDNGTRDVPLESLLSFWVFPLRLIAIVLAIPLIPTLLVYIMMRRTMTKYKKQMHKRA